MLRGLCLQKAAFDDDETQGKELTCKGGTGDLYLFQLMVAVAAALVMSQIPEG